MALADIKAQATAARQALQDQIDQLRAQAESAASALQSQIAGYDAQIAVYDQLAANGFEIVPAAQ